MTVTPGARFAQTKPVSAFAVGNKDGTGSPYTLLTVPAGKTYRLRFTHCSLVVASTAAYVASGSGESVTVQDSAGNIYAEAEAAVAAASQVCPQRGYLDCAGALLAPGTTVTLVIGGAPLSTTGLFVRIGGGAIWEPS